MRSTTRWQTTSPNSLNLVQNFGGCLCVQWTDRGTNNRLVVDENIGATTSI
ncbi:hypothetical protein EYF80_064619 [Liparis tanakae]|uniref:Uncharacterized protein n=1 Tax=Liparis tanakae TaxID=230148 RepID=A0A4Z2E984_9TELE|nr:hypothetical protein EYF80_064619 [Liparis tanakae]